MRTNELCENTAAVELTARMIANGREPHSVIIYGERGLGKRTIARHIAAQLLCEGGSGEPCGVCRQCRLVFDGSHPDFITAAASETGNYKVDDIRTLAADAFTAPSEGRYRITLIPDIDRSVQTLTQVQNTLLKVIEEPPPSAVLILTARSKEIFLDTIISRTLHLQAQEVTPSGAQSYLLRQGTEAALAEEAVRRCGGNIGECLRYCEDENVRRIADNAKLAAAAISQRDEYGLLKILSRYSSKKAELSALLRFMQKAVRDACFKRVGASEPRPYSESVCTALSVSHSQKRLADIYDELSQYISRLDANCQPSAAANALAAGLSQI